MTNKIRVNMEEMIIEIDSLVSDKFLSRLFSKNIFIKYHFRGSDITKFVFRDKYDFSHAIACYQGMREDII